MKITIEGNPIPKKRHRCRCVHGHGQAYDEQATNDTPIVKAIMKSQVKEKGPHFEYNQSLIVHFRFYIPINKSETNSKRNAKLWGFDKPTVKPDFDNLIKFYCDCANGVLWSDDCMVVEGSYFKTYSDFPRTEMEIMSKKELTLDATLKDILCLLSPEEWRKFFDEMYIIGCDGFSKLNSPMEDGDDLDRPFVLSQTALFLIDFAKKHVDLLKKIKTKGMAYVPNERDSIEGSHVDDGEPSMPR